MPKELFENPKYAKLSAEGILLYSIIRDRSAISMKNADFIDEHGDVFVYYTIGEICKVLRCGRDKAAGLLHELEYSGLVAVRRCKMSQPQRIYPLEFEPVFGKSDVGRSEKTMPGGREIRCREVGKSVPNNTDNNNTYLSKSDSGNDGSFDGPEAQPPVTRGFGKNSVLEWIKKYSQAEEESGNLM